jgi:hypothetical protein
MKTNQDHERSRTYHFMNSLCLTSIPLTDLTRHFTISRSLYHGEVLLFISHAAIIMLKL